VRAASEAEAWGRGGFCLLPERISPSILSVSHPGYRWAGFWLRKGLQEEPPFARFRHASGVPSFSGSPNGDATPPFRPRTALTLLPAGIRCDAAVEPRVVGLRGDRRGPRCLLPKSRAIIHFFRNSGFTPDAARGLAKDAHSAKGEGPKLLRGWSEVSSQHSLASSHPATPPPAGPRAAPASTAAAHNLASS